MVRTKGLIRTLHMLPLACLIALFGKTASAEEAFAISKVSVEPKSIDLSKEEKTVLRFETNLEAFLSIVLRDENANLLNRYELGLKSEGKHEFAWDGAVENGEPVRTDVVIYSIEGRTEGKRYARYDPSPETGGLDLGFLEFTVDPETGKIEYVLPKAARARLRAGLKNGALFKTVFDWSPTEAGRHSFVWDGLDRSGEVNVLKHPGFKLNLNAFSLPDNSIIIKGAEVNYQPPDKTFHGTAEGKHLHYAHPRMLCHEPEFRVILPESRTEDERGVPMLSGRFPFQVFIDSRDEEDLTRKRFEVMVYLDTAFLFEEEQALTPSTYYVDTAGLNPGDHLLTVNIMSYDDHVGVETLKIRVME